MMELVVFVLAGAMVLGGAVGVIASKHPVHAALSLVLTLFGVAVLFIAQEANFLAAVQVIVYAGAIVVLFLFVIMLLGVDRAEDLQVEPMRVQRPLAVVIGLSVAGLVGAAVIASRDVAPGRVGGGLEVALPDGGRTHDGNIRALARDVFSDHVLAFELTSVLLVIAVVATVMLARKPRKGETLLDANGGAA
jgi:NADH-quinone oxidoreductase subunit J